ncbi:MAG TPA: zinc-ribbon domain-containing protein [Ktedonobacterales bacterium]|nr:zinc-ribbon domain-containing protein [Ktedonobacterales bacterium]
MTYSKLGTDTKTGERVDIFKLSRLLGLYIIGLQSMGKSGLIEELIVQDIKQEIGVCVLDPHGELVDNIIAKLPDEKKEEKVIYLDLAETQYYFGLNLFACPDPTSDDEITKTVSQVAHVFEKSFGVSMSDTPRIYDYLFNGAYTLIANPGYTLLDIPLVFTNDLRQKLLATVPSAEVLRFWDDVTQLPKPDQSREERDVLRRLNDLSHAPLRFIVGQSHSTIDLRKIMDEGKILLVKLDRQREQATSLIGSIIVAQILNSANTRQTNKLFNLYADEFQNFATEDFAILLEQARKRGIGVTMAHQNRAQLELSDRQADKNLKARTLNVGNLVVFRVPTDAEELAKQFKAITQPGETEYKPVMIPDYKYTYGMVWEPPEAEQQLQEAKKATQALRGVLGEKARILFMLLSEEHRKRHSFTGEVSNDAYYALADIDVLTDPLDARPIFHYDNLRSSYLQDFFTWFWPQFNPPFHQLTFADVTPVPDPEKYLNHTELELTIRFWAKFQAYLLKHPVLTPAEQNISRLETSQPHYLAFVQQEIARLVRLPGEMQWNHLYWYVPETTDRQPPKLEAIYYPHMHGYWRINEGPAEIKQWLSKQLHALEKEIDEAKERERKLAAHYVQRAVKQELVGYHAKEDVTWRWDRRGERIVDSRETVYEQKPGSEETIANAQARVANELGRLPKFTAMVRLSDGDGNVVEHTIQTFAPGKGSYGQTLRERIERIHQRNIRDGYLKDRAQVEAEIVQRQQALAQSLQVEQSRPALTPQAQRRVLLCSSCGASNQTGALFCNQCGAKL